MRNIFVVLYFLMFQSLGFAAPNAKLNVVATTTDLAWLAREIGGTQVTVTSLLNGKQNPHYADANPNYILKASKADVVLMVGLELEIGWIPKVLQRSGNAKVQPGGKGYIEVGPSITVLEKPTTPVDRSMGDVHPHGNPHFWLSPTAMIEAAFSIAKAFSAVDVAHPENAKVYSDRAKVFETTMKQILECNKQKLKDKIAQIKVLEYHKEFSYFFNDYGLTSLGSLEEKPGVPASAGRIAQVAKTAKEEKVTVLLASEYSPRNQLNRFKELSGIDFAVTPTSIQTSGPVQDYEKLQDLIITKIIASIPAANLAAPKG